MPKFVAEPQKIADFREHDAWPDELAKPTRAPDSARFVVGWREWLALPDLGIPGIKAKVDTGARTSALHTHDYEIYHTVGGEKRVRFHLHPLRRSQAVELSCDAVVVDEIEVKDSGGHAELRPFIVARAQLGEFSWNIRVSLTNREGMKFRMLLGRTALAGLFIVDCRSSYLTGKSLETAYGL
jgi:hypothetical protein